MCKHIGPRQAFLNDLDNLHQLCPLFRTTFKLTYISHTNSNIVQNNEIQIFLL